MIEIIREDEWDRTKEQNDENRRMLPKDIRQMGKPDIGDRIYVEDRTYQTLHDHELHSEKTVYVLLGGFESSYGKQCVFVEAAIRLEEMIFDGGLPVWNDAAWAYIYKKLCQDYDDKVIVGWAMDIRGQLPGMTTRLESLHNSNFGGTHQVLLLMDTLEGEESFYCSAGGHLRRREGFYIYYDRNAAVTAPQTADGETVQKPEIPKQQETVQREESAQNPEISRNEEKTLWTMENDSETETQETPQGVYRKQILGKEKENPKPVFPSYAVSVVLTLIVCVLGYNAYQNYQKMNAMEKALLQMNTVEAAAVLETTEKEVETGSNTVKVEDVTGNVQPSQETASEDKEEKKEESGTEHENTESDGEENVQPEQTADAGETPESGGEEDAQPEQAAETMTEAQQYLAQGYYIVQKGDNLAEICRKVYQSTEMQDKLCEANGIENPDSIYAGQCLTLPDE